MCEMKSTYTFVLLHFRLSKSTSQLKGHIIIRVKGYPFGYRRNFENM